MGDSGPDNIEHQSPPDSVQTAARPPSTRTTRHSSPACKTAARTWTPGRPRAQLRQDHDPPPRPASLDDWLTAVEAGDQPELHSFANGVRRDQQAVTAGLTLAYSSAAVEGNVTRIKMINRQMYGRASFALRPVD